MSGERDFAGRRSGQYGGRDIRKVWRIGDVIVLWLDYEAKPELHRNIVGTTLDGSELWHAEVPGPWTIGQYTHVQVEEGRIHAYVATGFWVRLDAATGRILEQQFTK